jgi:hypothetical protein
LHAVLQTLVPLQPNRFLHVTGLHAPVPSHVPWQLLVVGSAGQLVVQQLIVQIPERQAELASLVDVGAQGVPGGSLNLQEPALQKASTAHSPPSAEQAA